MRSAAAFQLVTTPSVVRPMMASKDESTMASLSSSAASRRFCSLMSRRYAVNTGAPVTSAAAMLSSSGNSLPSARIPLTSMRLPRTGPSPVAR